MGQVRQGKMERAHGLEAHRFELCETRITRTSSSVSHQRAVTINLDAF